MGQTVHHQKIVIDSRLEEVCKVVDPILAAVHARGFPEQACFGIRLAMDEAVSNAVRHGNKSDPRKRVTVEYSLTDERFEVTVCDEGPGFNPYGVPDPTLDENIERPNGRGVMLMKAYMTEVHFNKTGNCVTLVKTRDCPLPLRPKR